MFVLLNDAMFCAFVVFCLLNLSVLKASALVFFLNSIGVLRLGMDGWYSFCVFDHLS